ncbi:Lysozyme [Pseudomonas viridiflava]|nr:Lysozyme [Pseudomonas viridiflava]
MERPEHAAMSAGWFWHRAGLNTLADKGDLLTITKRINGGTNGQADRQMLYERALKVLS